MERLLKAQTHNAVQPLQDTLKLKYIETLDVHPDRSDVYKADLNEQKEQRDAVKVDFEQLYWESIPEGSQVSFDQPFFPFRVAMSTLYHLRNLSFPFPYKKPKRLQLPRRKERRQK